MTTKLRYEGFQSLAKQINENACHFLCILSIAEEERERLEFDNSQIDLIEAIRISESKGWLRTSDFYVKNCLAILKYFTNKEWTRIKVEKLPATINGNEYTECNYYNSTTKREHFTRRSFDTLNNSITRRDGYLRYYYIYKCEEN